MHRPLPAAVFVVAFALVSACPAREPWRDEAAAYCEAHPAPEPVPLDCDGGAREVVDAGEPEAADAGMPPCDTDSPIPTCAACSAAILTGIPSCAPVAGWCPEGVRACPPGTWPVPADLLADGGTDVCEAPRGQLVTKKFCVE